MNITVRRSRLSGFDPHIFYLLYVHQTRGNISLGKTETNIPKMETGIPE
jgi:hypothetical protein